MKEALKISIELLEEALHSKSTKYSLYSESRIHAVKSLLKVELSSLNTEQLVKLKNYKPTQIER